MPLGEKIFALRTGRGMSQGELAEALDVSRQSVSKWENGSAVPELDKLVKMCGLFGVTLDELVRGETVPPGAGPGTGEHPREDDVVRAPLPARKIAGLFLLGTGAVVFFLPVLLRGSILAGAILCLPFAVCGGICMLVRRHAALCCFWVLFAMVHRYLRYGTGIGLWWVLSPWIYNEQMSVHAIVAWAEVLCLLLLIAATARAAHRAYRARKK